MDTEMDRLHLHVDTPCAKSASKKSVFGSLERSMDRLLCMLTPKKKRSTPSSSEEPRTVKVSQCLIVLLSVKYQQNYQVVSNSHMGYCNVDVQKTRQQTDGQTWSMQ